MSPVKGGVIWMKKEKSEKQDHVCKELNSECGLFRQAAIRWIQPGKGRAENEKNCPSLSSPCQFLCSHEPASGPGPQGIQAALQSG